VKQIEIGEAYPLPEGLSIIPLSVPHRKECSKIYGFFLRGRWKRLLYIPDIDRWEDWDTNLDNLMTDNDYYLIDGTFYSEKELKSIWRSYIKFRIRR